MPRIGSYILICTLALAGCRSKEEAKFTEWSSDRTLAPATGSGAKLIEIGEAVEASAIAAARGKSPITARTTFFSPERKQARAVIGGQGAALLRLSAAGFKVRFTPTGMNQPPRYLRGIRLIGEALIWDQEYAISKQDFSVATMRCGQITRLGLQLMGGGGLEASLGASLIDRSRRLISSNFHQLGAGQLAQLGKALKGALGSAPGLTDPLENERENMLLSLQQAQDLAQKLDFKTLEARMGSSCHDEVTLLASLQKDPSKIAGVFDWIGQDIMKRGDWQIERVRNPKTEAEEPDLKQRKNWRVFYRYFASNLDSLAPMLKRSVARTRLFTLECFLRQKVKIKAPLPAAITEFKGDIITDPFSGSPFHYRSDASAFRVYSVGADLVDDGGETNETFDSPDLVVERKL